MGIGKHLSVGDREPSGAVEIDGHHAALVEGIVDRTRGRSLKEMLRLRSSQRGDVVGQAVLVLHRLHEEAAGGRRIFTVDPEALEVDNPGGAKEIIFLNLPGPDDAIVPDAGV